MKRKTVILKHRNEGIYFDDIRNWHNYCCMLVCMYYRCIWVCECVCGFEFSSSCVHVYCVCMCISVGVCMYFEWYKLINRQLDVPIYCTMYSHIHSHLSNMQAHMHTCTHADTPTHTHIRKYTHTYAHTQTYPHKCTHSLSPSVIFFFYSVWYKIAN